MVTPVGRCMGQARAVLRRSHHDSSCQEHEDAANASADQRDGATDDLEAELPQPVAGEIADECANQDADNPDHDPNKCFHACHSRSPVMMECSSEGGTTSSG